MISVKKNLTTLGYVTINNTHPFSKGNNGFQISPRLQELMVYAGQTDSYENCNEVIKTFINVEVSSSQVYRVADLYGAVLQDDDSKDARLLSPVSPQEVLYAQADGSMLLTREEGWSEVKLGRVFKSSQCIHAEGKPGWISNSQYIAHLGSHKDFCKRMDDLLDDFGSLKQRLVFITDGAVWLRNWIADSFPEAISILDFYHASEHLHQFANSSFKDAVQKLTWVDRQKQLLLSSKVPQVIENIKALGNTKEARQLIAYYQSNIERMDYKKYQQTGIGLIGSGAIESAHRTVIQKRMKQSGQRWSKIGATNMLALRTTRKNGQWCKVIALTKQNFKIAA